MRRVVIVSLLALCLGSATAAFAAEFFFKDGDDPIVFLGDSITEQKMYTAYIEAYVLTRFPDWKVRFRNIGWGGDAAELWQRGGYDNGMKRDVLPLKAAAITIDFGMNDARGGDRYLPKYVEYSTRLAKDLKAAGTRVALCTPSPEEKDEPGQPGGSAYNNMLWKYSQALQKIAQEQGVQFVDQYTGFVKVIEDGRKAGIPKFILIPDHVHPNWAGHLIMAHQILKALGAPSLVSRASIGVGGRSVILADKCQVNDLKVEGNSLSFTRLDDCLPMPVRPDSALVFKVPGYSFLDDLDQYELKVTGLAAGKYTLSIDGQRIHEYTDVQLTAGLSLALDAAPVLRQGLQLLNLVLDKNNLYFNRWRNVQLKSPPGDGRTAELARCDAEIADRETKINALRKPVAHQWELKPAG
jgi:lysophospholipase L1-like esterase